MTLSPISGTELGEQNESYLDLIQEIYAALRKLTYPFYDTSIFLTMNLFSTHMYS